MLSLALIEPDHAHGCALRAHLEAAEFRVCCFENAPAGLAAVRSIEFDLCLLSLDFPGVDGVEMCSTIRRERAGLPIVATTAQFSEGHGVEALLAGADDVVAKQSNARELVARIHAVLRRSGKGKSGPAFQDEELTVLLDEMRVVLRGTTIPLSLGETRVLAMLIRESPSPVSLDHIHTRLSVESDLIKRTTIEARIKSLRRKLGRNRIETQSQFGYAFVAHPH